MRLPFWRRSELNAASFIRSKGYRLIVSGYRVKEGEVDLIAWDGEVLVFIEVKSRNTADPPEDAVGFTKQRRIVRAAHAYIASYKLHDKTYRFDIVTVNQNGGESSEYRLLQDAFRPTTTGY